MLLPCDALGARPWEGRNGKAKDKQLELFRSLLHLRDRQIGELQTLCEQKQALCQSLGGQIAREDLTRNSYVQKHLSLAGGALLMQPNC